MGSLSTASSVGGLEADLPFPRCVRQDLKQYAELSCSSMALIQVIGENFKDNHRGSKKQKKTPRHF